MAASRPLLALLLAEKGERAGALDEAHKAAEIVQSLIGTPGANHLGTLSRYWSRVGEMYQALAQQKDAPPEQRIADLRAAKDAYQHSAAEWRASLAPARQTEIGQLESKIAQCDAAIGSLVR